MGVAGVGLVYNPGLGHCQFATKLAGNNLWPHAWCKLVQLALHLMSAADTG